MINPTRRARSQRGSAIVEGALCLTVFLMLIFGIMDFGRAVFGYNFVSAGAREGSRYAMTRGASSGRIATASAVTAYVKTWAVGLDPTAISVNTTWTPDNQPGSVVKVNVQYTFQPIVPYMPSGSLTVQATSQMLISQ